MEVNTYMVVLVLWRSIQGCVGIVEVGTWLCWYCGGWYVVVLVLWRLVRGCVGIAEVNSLPTVIQLLRVIA